MSERTLPDLPDGWRLGHLIERVKSQKNLRANGGGLWRCNLRPGVDHNGDYKSGVTADGNTPREAVINAIAIVNTTAGDDP